MSITSSSNGAPRAHALQRGPCVVAQVAAGRVAASTAARVMAARARYGVEREEPGIRDRLETAGRRGDHRRVVGAQSGGGIFTCTPSCRRRARAGAELAATPPPIASRAPVRLERALDADDQRLDDRVSKEAARSAARRASPPGRGRAPCRRARSSGPLKEKSSPSTRAPAGKSNAAGSPSRARDDLRAARIAEPDHPRGLVERLSGGVVARRAEQLVGSRARSTRASRVWPPLAIRHRNGGSIGSGSR